MNLTEVLGDFLAKQQTILSAYQSGLLNQTNDAAKLTRLLLDAQKGLTVFRQGSVQYKGAWGYVLTDAREYQSTLPTTNNVWIIDVANAKKIRIAFQAPPLNMPSTGSPPNFTANLLGLFGSFTETAQISTIEFPNFSMLITPRWEQVTIPSATGTISQLRQIAWGEVILDCAGCRYLHLMMVLPTGSGGLLNFGDYTTAGLMESRTFFELLQ